MSQQGGVEGVGVQKEVDAAAGSSTTGRGQAPEACQSPDRKEPASTRPTMPENCLVVQRIGLHIKGARFLVALAPRLDTPTITVTSAPSIMNTADQNATSSTSRRVGLVGTASAEGAGDGNADGYNLQDQNLDAEVLPRRWEVTHGAMVYMKDRGEGKCAAGSRRSSQPRAFDSSPHRRMYGRKGSGGTGDDHHESGSRRQGRRDRHSRETRLRSTSGGSSSFIESEQELMRWRELTEQPCDLVVLVDTDEERGISRVLLSMPEYGKEEEEEAKRQGKKPGGLYVSTSMAEYYLLLSVYFGEDKYCSLEKGPLTTGRILRRVNLR